MIGEAAVGLGIGTVGLIQVDIARWCLIDLMVLHITARRIQNISLI